MAMLRAVEIETVVPDHHESAFLYIDICQPKICSGEWLWLALLAELFVHVAVDNWLKFGAHPIRQAEVGFATYH